MIPEWFLFAMNTSLGILIGVTSTFFFNKSEYKFPFLFFTLIVFIILIFLYVKNENFKNNEKIKYDKINVSGVNVVDLLPENLPEQNSMLKGSTRPSLMGMLFIGRRHNLIKTNWYKDYFNNEIRTIKQNSRLAVSDKIKEQVFIIPPNKTCEIEFIGNPKIDRKDYLFSVYSYTDKKNFKDIGLSISISNEKNELIKKSFSFKKSNIKMIPTQSKLEVYQPYISHLFSSVPNKIKGSLEISNNSKKDFNFIISFPTLEEGLFPTEAVILSGESLANSFLSFGRDSDFFTTLQGTTTIVLQPFFNPEELTPGINPVFLHCVNKERSNGIEIFCDSKDNGKLKAKIINNNVTDIITSDVSLFKNYVYGISLRWSEDQVDLVVNGRNISILKGKSIPTNKDLPKSIYLGCSPISVDDSANSILALFVSNPEWMNNDVIELYLMEKFPIIFNKAIIKN